jgi:hypothetical protein
MSLYVKHICDTYESFTCNSLNHNAIRVKDSNPGEPISFTHNYREAETFTPEMKPMNDISENRLTQFRKHVE